MGRISQWYLRDKGHKPPPRREGLNQIPKDREELYRFLPPKGRWVTVLLWPGEVDDGVPDDMIIAVAVRGIQGGNRWVPSGMQTEDLKGWLWEATRKD